MMGQDKPQILLTNDDGIRSPGLWAAAEGLSGLGFVTVAAPRDQSSGTGRSMPITSDGVILEEEVEVLGEGWRVYAVGGTPAQSVQHGILELMPRRPDLVVAGINYGENVGLGVTISGTVGAAIEGAAFGISSLAISLEADLQYHLSYSEEVDFSIAMYFACYFGQILMKMEKLHDVHVLKVEIPCDATRETAWQITKLSRVKYYTPIRPKRQSLAEPTRVGYRRMLKFEDLEPGTDAYAIQVDRQIAVTPLSMDLSSRVDLADLDLCLRRVATECM
jgi:5'-nucleotidase